MGGSEKGKREKRGQAPFLGSSVGKKGVRHLFQEIVEVT